MAITDLQSVSQCLELLRQVDERQVARAAWGRPGRQPVHTVYGGGHLFRRNTAAKFGELALRSLDQYCGSACSWAQALGLPGAETLPRSVAEARALEGAVRDAGAAAARVSPAAWLAVTVWDRVREKLEREPVEDYRIDFEDGYGYRTAEEEDGHVQAAAREVAAGVREGTLPPFIGLRVKSFAVECRARALRSLELFFEAFAAEAVALPPWFAVTLPKVTHEAQVSLLVACCRAIEARHGWKTGAILVELMVEHPQAIIAADGRFPLSAFVEAGDGRVVAVHFGTYDFTASCDVTAAEQRMRHPLCDYAKHAMQVSLAGTGVWVVDGATNVMPIGPHSAKSGPLTPGQEEENRRVVQAAWRLHFENALHSLRGGFYQGWDLHPAQLPARYAALDAFFLGSMEAASTRLRNFVDKAAQATRVGEVFDDAATGQGLLAYFQRALGTGALTVEEAERLSGLTREELDGRSFQAVVEGRRG